jgi:dihydroflavonol-4-reductase
VNGLPVETMTGDLLDPRSLSRAVHGCVNLFHCAADYRIWVPDPQRMYPVNVGGTRALMLAALEAGVRRVVYTSSVATLATASDRPGDETRSATPGDLIGSYKRSKLRRSGGDAAGARMRPAGGYRQSLHTDGAA